MRGYNGDDDGCVSPPSPPQHCGETILGSGWDTGTWHGTGDGEVITALFINSPNTLCFVLSVMFAF